ncbi:SDR family oxidoreductase [Pirellulaceae bacterium]|nr:SDR family oxidoreductase [Pirellulaceae bacterium]
MDLALTNNGVLVVGGAKGIGHAIARQFALEGADVILADIDPHVHQSANTMDADVGGNIRGVVLDATDYQAVETLAGELNGEDSNLNHIVYAAGVGSNKFGFPFWEMEPSDWPFVLEVNLMGAVNVAHAFAPRMQQCGTGSILFIASIAAQMGSQTDPPYSAAKAALVNFMQVVAKDFAPYNVRANAISPGMIQTTLNKSVWAAWNERQSVEDKRKYEDWADDKISKICPLGRWQTPDDIGKMAVILASQAAQNVTGQTVNVDGGIIMHS